MAERLSPRARTVWRAEWAGYFAVTLVAAILAARVLDTRWGWVLPVGALALTIVEPGLRWRRWCWAVRESEIETEHGVLISRRTLIPILRVQHVETTRNVLEQALGLATVRIHTAAGGHTIPLLEQDHADALRDWIAELTRAEAGDG